MRREKEVPSRNPIGLREQIVGIHDISDRLGHLLAANRNETVVQPRGGKLIARRARLSEFVLVVGKTKVKPSPVDVKGAPQIARRHR